MTKITPDGLPELLSICRWGRRFYSEASEASRRQEQAQAMQALEMQRATLASELQGFVEELHWAGSLLIPEVRGASQDHEILDLCDRLDARTIAAYQEHLGKQPAGSLRSLLERHLALLAAGQERRAALRQN